MVKISIKKDKKAKTKPRLKQKQKQSQKVIVNIGSNATRAKRRSTLESNKAVNRSIPTPTPNIIVPQAMPQNTNNEILRYIRESEQQKEMIKKQEKNNELEKDKIKAKEKKQAIIPDEEKAQVQFTVVNSRNISGISSGLATPTYNPLSTPLNYRSLQNALGVLMQRADIEGENPNTGRISLSTYNPPSSGSSIMSDGGYNDDNDSFLSYESRTPLKHTPTQNSLTDILQNEVVEDEEVYIEPTPEQEVATEAEVETVINETPQQQEPPMETITNEPSEVDAVIIDTPEPEKTAYEQADEAMKMMDDALKPNKATESRQAEDTGPMIEIKTVDTPRTPPQFTKEQLKKMRANQVGDILTAEKVKDRGKELIFNGALFFRGREEVKLPEVKKILLSQYGVSDL